MEIKVGKIDPNKKYVVVCWTGTFDYWYDRGNGQSYKEARYHENLFEIKDNVVDIDSFVKQKIREQYSQIIARNDWSDIKITKVILIEPKVEDKNIVIK